MTRFRLSALSTPSVLALVLMGACAAPPAARAQTPPDGLEWRVLTEINRFYDDVSDPTNRPAVIRRVPDGVIRAVEVNGDGKPDWLIEWPQESWFCGTGGCAWTLYVSGEHGLTRALDRQGAVTLSEVGGETRVEIAVHHLYCADDRMDCRFAYAWDDAARVLVPRPSSDGVSTLTGAGPLLIDDGARLDARAPDHLPQALQNVWDEQRAVCLVDYNEGAEARTPAIVAAHDLNGDGRVDWVVQPPMGCDAAADGPGVQIWVSSGDGLALAFTGRPGDGFETELGRDMTWIKVANDQCAAVDCPMVSLAWDAATKTLDRR